MRAQCDDVMVFRCTYARCQRLNSTIVCENLRWFELRGTGKASTATWTHVGERAKAMLQRLQLCLLFYLDRG